MSGGWGRGWTWECEGRAWGVMTANGKVEAPGMDGWRLWVERRGYRAGGGAFIVEWGLEK